ncbi:MAG: hypothetical protein MZU95_03720 [Desulfomicrobium escambiense]|nr:hypothetical protein [Desulfomicrobium escambiense]
MLGLDLGERRIGVALSDPTGTIASRSEHAPAASGQASAPRPPGGVGPGARGRATRGGAPPRPAGDRDSLVPGGPLRGRRARTAPRAPRVVRGRALHVRARREGRPVPWGCAGRSVRRRGGWTPQRPPSSCKPGWTVPGHEGASMPCALGCLVALGCSGPLGTPLQLTVPARALLLRRGGHAPGQGRRASRHGLPHLRPPSR